MIISILSLFPEIFPSVLNCSITGRAQKKGLVTIKYINIREFATDKHRTVDDKPYGGGIGMILRVDILDRAITSARLNVKDSRFKEKVILLDPKGKLYNQATARKYSKLDHIIIVCGHYEGMDARINNFVDETVSIGRFILTGGEIPAMIMTDSITRLIPHVLDKEEAILSESFSTSDYLEYPQYTRPANYKGLKVPEVLISGNHQKIKSWKKRLY